MDLNIEFNAAPIRRSMVSKKVLTCAGVLLVTAGCAWNQMAKSEFSLVRNTLAPAKAAAKAEVGDADTITKIKEAAKKVKTLVADTSVCPADQSASGASKTCYDKLRAELEKVPNFDTLKKFEDAKQKDEFVAAVAEIKKAVAFTQTGAQTDDAAAVTKFTALLGKFKAVKGPSSTSKNSTDTYTELAADCQDSGVIGVAIKACKNETELDSKCVPAVETAIKDPTLQEIKNMKDGIDTKKEEAVKCLKNFRDDAYKKVENKDKIKALAAGAIFRNIGGINWLLIIGCIAGAIGLAVVGFFVYKKFGAKEGAATAGAEDAA